MTAKVTKFAVLFAKRKDFIMEFNIKNPRKVKENQEHSKRR